MPPLKRVGIGLIGAGFLARTRMRCYAQVSGYQAEIVAVASDGECAKVFGNDLGIGDEHRLSVDVKVAKQEDGRLDQGFPDHKGIGCRSAANATRHPHARSQAMPIVLDFHQRLGDRHWQHLLQCLSQTNLHHH